MSKITIWIVIAVVLTILFGTWPLSVLAKLFEWLAWVVGKAAKLLDLFHWNGIAKIGVIG